MLDPTSGTLLSEALPPWLRIDGTTEQAGRFRWLLDELVTERTQRLPGNALVASQLAQLLFVQILRAQMNGNSRIPRGWLRALGDPRLAPAVQLMHEDPARSWHLDELARACAMSRSSFAALYRDGRYRAARLSCSVAYSHCLQGAAGRRFAGGLGCRPDRLFLARSVQQCLQAGDRPVAFSVARKTSGSQRGLKPLLLVRMDVGSGFFETFHFEPSPNSFLWGGFRFRLIETPFDV
ncbi:cupin domain-containing protein [Rhizobium laguerreae]|uniref:cupin domain-containing protein n=1 Tax=Rhizobium laguerreae TaxID=1076926 RepID=UPI001FE5D41C|nr:cupin domain-containing protein [Rhizobium laguerreae]